MSANLQISTRNDSIEYGKAAPKGHRAVMGQAVLASVNEKTHLCTTGLFTCFGLTLYDPEKRIGSVSHLHDLSAIESHCADLIQHLESLGAKREKLYAHLITGPAEGNTLSREIETIELFCQKNSIILEGSNLAIPPLKRPTAVTLSLEDGVVTVWRGLGSVVQESSQENDLFVILSPKPKRQPLFCCDTPWRSVSSLVSASMIFLLNKIYA